MVVSSRFYLATSSFIRAVLKSSPLYGSVCLGILLYFLSLRTPFTFEVFSFLLLDFWLILPLFLCLFFSRITRGCRWFFASLLPPGTPLWIAPFVGLAETVSYIVRPFILLVRPFLKIRIGAFVGAGLGGACVLYSWVFPFLFFLFVYEVFVAMVHWFIVASILKFSVDH